LLGGWGLERGDGEERDLLLRDHVYEGVGASVGYARHVATSYCSKTTSELDIPLFHRRLPNADQPYLVAQTHHDRHAPHAISKR
jgi:hypothetical protein